MGNMKVTQLLISSLWTNTPSYLFILKKETDKQHSIVKWCMDLVQI